VEVGDTARSRVETVLSKSSFAPSTFVRGVSATLNQARSGSSAGALLAGPVPLPDTRFAAGICLRLVSRRRFRGVVTALRPCTLQQRLWGCRGLATRHRWLSTSRGGVVVARPDLTSRNRSAADVWARPAPTLANSVRPGPSPWAKRWCRRGDLPKVVPSLEAEHLSVTVLEALAQPSLEWPC
jgi:hypothetical protein